MRQMKVAIHIKHTKARYSITSIREVNSLNLNEFCIPSGYTRKHAIAPLTKRIADEQERPVGHKKVYTPAALPSPLKQIWHATDQMCSKCIKGALPIKTQFYERTYGNLNEGIKQVFYLTANT